MKNLIKKLINRETITYLIFGVLTTVVNFGAQWIFTKLLATRADTYNLMFQVATAIAWVIAVLFAFITNKLWVFESKSFKGRTVLKEVLSFFGARLLSFLLFDEALQSGILYIINRNVTDYDILTRNSYIAKFLICVFVVIFNYFASKFFIFRKKKESDDVRESETENK